MYNVMNTLSEYTYFYISKNITSCTFLLVFKIVENLQCIVNIRSEIWRPNLSKTIAYYRLLYKIIMLSQESPSGFCC